jgi:hypothetical protein
VVEALAKKEHRMKSVEDEMDGETPRPRPAALLAHTVTVTGDVTEKDGMTMLSASAGDVKMIK